MTRKFKIMLAGVGLVGATAGMAADLDFVMLADANRLPQTVVVRVSAADVLVFKGTVPYVLHGRRLIVAAPTIRVDGPFQIQQFDATDTALPREGVANQPPAKPMGRRASGRNGAPGAEGSTGNTGAAGHPGKDAPLIVLDVGQILGPGPLVIDNSGGKGGPGQAGSQGGTGGAGESGANGSDHLLSCKAGGADGGHGGRGGKGGTGGVGGPGGKGGTVKLSAAALAKQQAADRALQVQVDGGAGGEPGVGGKPGVGGAGGPGGSGSTYCSGGSGKPPGSGGDPGDNGMPGPAGAPGAVQAL